MWPPADSHRTSSASGGSVERRGHRFGRHHGIGSASDVERRHPQIGQTAGCALRDVVVLGVGESEARDHRPPVELPDAADEANLVERDGERPSPAHRLDHLEQGAEHVAPVEPAHPLIQPAGRTVEIEGGGNRGGGKDPRIHPPGGVTQHEVAAHGIAQEQHAGIEDDLRGGDGRLEIGGEPGVVEVLAAPVRPAQGEPEARPPRPLGRPRRADAVVASGGATQAVNHHEQGVRSGEVPAGARSGGRGRCPDPRAPSTTPGRAAAAGEGRGGGDRGRWSRCGRRDSCSTAPRRSAPVGPIPIGSGPRGRDREPNTFGGARICGPGA